MICSPDGLMIYNDSNAIVDDIPLLSQWIKKRLAFASRFLYKGYEKDFLRYLIRFRTQTVFINFSYSHNNDMYYNFYRKKDNNI